MATVILRFYGRFVFAQPTNTNGAAGSLDVLAVNMQFNPAVGADPHHAVVTALRELVRFPDTNRLPDLMLMAAEEDASSAEHALWNLDGSDVTIKGADGFDWDDKDKIADLNQLTNGTGRLAARSLTPPPAATAVTTARIHLSQGRGIADQLVAELFQLVKIRDPKTPMTPKALPLADKVDITVTVPDDDPNITLRLTRRDGSTAGNVVIGTKGPIPTIVTFSNLCAQPTRELDDEFAGLYEVLENPPAVADRLVPFGKRPESGTRDCYSPAFIAY